ncbi:MAG: carbohydrate ABC transporter permease [Ferrovibrio sp.]|uniref:carbohydrate ABC transporter permease n=1 Tax=Ferrovibrio sp. TaxID=1917215 RepID=UPI003918A432
MRKILNEGRLALVGVLILVWTLIPIYHLFVMSITPRVETFAGAIWPSRPTLENYETVVEQGHYYLEHFWQQLWNSAFVAVMVCLITLAISATATFAISRLRVRGGRLVSNMALATYLIPPAFLAIPMYKVMGIYGLLNTQWSLIFTMVTFASPYAIWVLKQYADKLPYELDEAARIDGASPLQIFRLIYLPLMAPSLVAIGTYALLLAWNEYLYAFLLLSADKEITLAVALGHFLTTDDAPFNVLMATGAVYALPPAAIYYAFRRYMVSGLTAGAVKS